MDLILLAALIVAVVLYRRRGVGRVDVGTMVRRFLEYGFLYGLVMVSAIGATGVLGRFLDLISDSDVGGPEELALWLSLLLLVVLLVPGAAGSGLCREGDLDGLLLDIAAPSTSTSTRRRPASGASRPISRRPTPISATPLGPRSASPPIRSPSARMREAAM